MSNIFFCFSDECGDYKPSMTDNNIIVHPYYIRSTLIIDATEWKLLNNRLNQLKTKYGLHPSKEIKWANLWTVWKYQVKKQLIPLKFQLQHIQNVPFQTLINYVEEALGLINSMNYKKIIITYTSNHLKHLTNERTMMAFHIQEHMQRVEMELNVNEDNLGVLFFDPVSTKKNEMFREIYNDFFQTVILSKNIPQLRIA